LTNTWPIEHRPPTIEFKELFGLLRDHKNTGENLRFAKNCDISRISKLRRQMTSFLAISNTIEITNRISRYN
jgi:hypothetical protein